MKRQKRQRVMMAALALLMVAALLLPIVANVLVR